MTQCPRYAVYANPLYYPFSVHNNSMEPIAEDILLQQYFSDVDNFNYVDWEFWELIPYILTLLRLLKLFYTKKSYFLIYIQTGEPTYLDFRI